MYATLRIASWSRPRAWLAVAACLLLLPGVAPAQTTWTGAVNSLWSNSGNWTNGVPTATTNTTIGPALVYLDTDGATQNLSLLAMLLSSGGARNLTVNGNFSWTGNTMGGAGTTTLKGAANSISATSVALTQGRSLVNDVGATTSLNQSQFFADGNASVTNNGTFNINTTTDGQRALDNNNSLQPSLFINNSGGTLARTSGTGTAIVAWRLDNYGTVNIGSGLTLRFEAGGNLRNNGQTTGAGTFRINGSTMTVGNAASEVFTFGSTTTRMDGGTLTGLGNMVFSGNLDWTNGTLSGTGGTELRGSNNRMRSNALTLNRAVVNNGTTNLEGTITVTGNSPASWTNNGTFNFTGDGTLAGSQTFTNASTGVLAKTGGTGTSTVNWTVNNAGLIRVDSSGILNLAGGFSQSSTGEIVANNGGTVTFASPITVQGGLAGTGTVNAGTVNHSNGTIAPGSSAGTLTINGNLGLASSSILDFEFGPKGGTADDKLVVIGALTLPDPGTPLTLNILGNASDMFARTGDVVPLIDYGTLTAGGSASSIQIGSTPTGSTYGYAIIIDEAKYGTNVMLQLPEPSTVVLGISLSLMGLVLAWRKRKAAR